MHLCMHVWCSLLCFGVESEDYQHICIDFVIHDNAIRAEVSQSSSLFIVDQEGREPERLLANREAGRRQEPAWVFEWGVYREIH